MNINCINNKIITVKGVLQPIVLQAIKDIYLQGNNQMNACMVKDHCLNIAPNTSWDGRVPTICNAMRNSIQCGGRIIGEDRDFLDFTIAFDGNGSNIESKITKKTTSKDKENRNMRDEKSTENSIENFSEKNSTSSSYSIFLIPCSSRKILNEELESNPFDINKLEFNNELGDFRKELICKLKIAEQNNTHKRKKTVTKNKISKTEKINITNEFDFHCTAQANILYSKGNFYRINSSDSVNWKKNDKERIYIVSALFGIIRADNYIPLYDLAMNDEIDRIKNFAQRFWNGKLDVIIEKLISNGCLIYNLLGETYKNSINKTLQLTIVPDIKVNGSDADEKRGKWLKKNLLNQSNRSHLSPNLPSAKSIS